MIFLFCMGLIIKILFLQQTTNNIRSSSLENSLGSYDDEQLDK